MPEYLSDCFERSEESGIIEYGMSTARKAVFMVAKKIIISAVLILLIYENTLLSIAATELSKLEVYS